MTAGAATVLVRGGRAALPGGTRVADLLIADGRFAAIGSSADWPAADRVIDADGLLVLPGLVDAHVHVRDPGLTSKEDFSTAGAAAAAGGVTTIVVMPHDDPLTYGTEVLADKARLAAERCVVDVAFAAAVGSENVDAIPELAAAGVVSAELLLDQSPPSLGDADLGTLNEALDRCRSAGLPLGVYCETATMTARLRASLRGAGARGLSAHAAAHPAVGEELAVAAACRLALETGGPLHLRQLSAARSFEIAATAKSRGADLTVETTPHYLALTHADGGDAVGFKVLPPLRRQGDVRRARGAVASGLVDVVATDHAPHSPAERAAAADDIWASPSGFAGLETLLPVVNTIFGSDAPEILARACARGPAARFGLSHRKGRIDPGLDADLVLVDTARHWPVDSSALRTRAAHSPFAGRTLRGKVVATLRRGQSIFSDGELLPAEPGEWIRRASAPQREAAA